MWGPNLTYVLFKTLQSFWLTHEIYVRVSKLLPRKHETIVILGTKQVKVRKVRWKCWCYCWTMPASETESLADFSSKSCKTRFAYVTKVAGHKFAYVTKTVCDTFAIVRNFEVQPQDDVMSGPTYKALYLSLSRTKSHIHPFLHENVFVTRKMCLRTQNVANITKVCVPAEVVCDYLYQQTCKHTQMYTMCNF
jgi:hypothetical protein